MSTVPTVADPPAQSISPDLAHVPSSQHSLSLDHAVVDPTMLKRLGLHTADELDRQCVEESKKAAVIEGLLSVGSIGILVGDSGLGKTPLVYQLALSVAAGVPFLGMRTSGGSVVYVDCENGIVNSQALQATLVRHLGIPRPRNFFPDYEPGLARLSSIVRELKPALVVIDTLRSFDPTAEKDNTHAGLFINNLKAMRGRGKTSFLLIHHIKKPESGGFLSSSPSLEHGSVMQWLNQACGARALINQTDTRIGIDETSKGDAELVIVAHSRVRGETSPYFLGRVRDEALEPVGYRRLTGIVTLLGKDAETAFEKLPPSFRFKEAKQILGKGSQSTTNTLKRFIALELLSKAKGGEYQKVPHAPDSSEL
jgi:AAA domain